MKDALLKVNSCSYILFITYSRENWCYFTEKKIKINWTDNWDNSIVNCLLNSIYFYPCYKTRVY